MNPELKDLVVNGRWAGPTHDFKFELKDVDEKTGEFAGLASGTGNKDAKFSIIEQGAFTRTIAMWIKSGQNVPVLWQHFFFEPIGLLDPNKMQETKRGLEVQGRFVMSITRAQEARDLLIAKAIRGMSIGFTIPKGKATFDEAADVVRIREVRLWEDSIVTFPANDRAKVTTIRSHCGADPQSTTPVIADPLNEHSVRLERVAKGIDSDEEVASMLALLNSLNMED